MSPDKLALRRELGALLDRVCREEPFSGVVLVSQDNADVFVRSCGYANRSWKVPNSRDTRFRIASVGKTHTAAAVLQLVERGLLSLDAPMVQFLALEGAKIPAEVTIRHLLTMTSGIADWIDESPSSRWNWESLKRTTPLYLLRTAADYLPLFAYREPRFPPGESWSYCNANYVLLGMAVEKVSGVPYTDYMRRNVFRPAGMSDTDFLPANAAADRVAEATPPFWTPIRTWSAGRAACTTSPSREARTAAPPQPPTTSRDSPVCSGADKSSAPIYCKKCSPPPSKPRSAPNSASAGGTASASRY